MGSGSAKIGYAAMLEQFGPQEVVNYSVAAERAGMSGVMAADHFQPWVPEQGNAPFVWNVAALAKWRGDDPRWLAATAALGVFVGGTLYKVLGGGADAQPSASAAASSSQSSDCARACCISAGRTRSRRWRSRRPRG